MINWKEKLAAYLHDPPSKCLDIRTHGERSDAAFRQAGFIGETEIGEYFKHADHTGAAADRLPFPNSQAAGLQCVFDGVRNAFLHPLGGQRSPFHSEFKSAEQGFEGEGSVQPKLTDESLKQLESEELRWRARFFAHWRLWPKHATEKDYRLGLLPADTRIPDHTIWTHMQVVSALAGCVSKDKVWRPAFLKFQIGPVQDFIAAARSIRDLWSGSYLLSWLMAAGLKALSERVGPDAVIFPNLRGQPLFDLQWRDELWRKVKIGSRPVWESLPWDKDTDRAVLTPNLPNVFLALVPADTAREIGRYVADAIQREWRRIAESVWTECQKAGLTAREPGIDEQERKCRFDHQIERFLSLSWQATAWPNTLADALKMAENFVADMPIQKAKARVEAVVKMATQVMPLEHRDSRYYTDASKTHLNNVGLGWSIIVALNGWQLDAVRQTRNFPAANPGGWTAGAFNNKDALTGREEAVAGGRAWSKRAWEITQTRGGPWAALFKHEDWLGAPILVKRLWHFAYLAQDPWKLDFRNFPMPNTRGIAAHAPEENCDDETVEDEPVSEKYFAVLALDGDEIGKWMSGEKTPHLSTQLAHYQDGTGNRGFGSKPYFERYASSILNQQRPLSPSYHLQFSEALSNFALMCARQIVEAFDGRLIYAGGDDVLALLPADTALACATALRMAFKGSSELKNFLKTNCQVLRNRHESEESLNSNAPPPPYYQKLAAEDCLLGCLMPGFVTRLDHVDQENRPIPLLVPGEEADCSVGLAVAHFKSPLQDVVREARFAERRAKRELGKAAVTVTLMKRSGEIIKWGCRWDSHGVEAYRALVGALGEGIISGKFPHRVVELLEPYLADDLNRLGATRSVRDFDGVSDAIIARELAHAADRQRGPNYTTSVIQPLINALHTYWTVLPDAQAKLRGLIGLCQTVAFAARTAYIEPAPTSRTPSAVSRTEPERQLA
nr:hypothetical protein Hi04_10k_c110_00004 [uncultured bacterium]